MKYTEAQCSEAVRRLLAPYCDDAYSHEVGGLGQWDGGKFKPRAGGTRTTPGFPDMTFYMRLPRQFTLTVEAKGYATRVAPEQWVYALNRMDRGDPHLIVRSPQAVIGGLRYLGLLPERLSGEPFSLPDNAAFLPRTRLNMVVRHDWILPEYARGMELVWNSKRTLVQPSHVADIVSRHAIRKARAKTMRQRKRRS